jgi:anti-anti-sigma regulatory factor
LTLERNETHCVVRLEGDCSMTSAAQLKALLLDGLASASELWVDLENVGEIDISVLQLLWAAYRAAARQNREVVSRVPAAIQSLARDAGFESFPGEIVEAEQAVEALEILEG